MSIQHDTRARTPEIRRSRLHRAALEYPKRKVPVSRLAPRTKVPLAGTHGHLDATLDRDTIDEWWTETPNANLAMPTGAVSGRVVIEVDPRNGGDETLRDLEAEHGPLPDTQRVLSGRGDGGYHMHFEHPGAGIYIKSGANLLGPGVDVKADGGQVVLPPSIHPASGKPYQWDAGAHIDDVPMAELPGWVLSKLTETKPRPAAPTSDDWTIPEGGRHHGILSIGGDLRRKAFNSDEIGAFLLAVNQQRCCPPLPDSEVLSIARSLDRYAPSDVPDFSEAAEESARREADRLRQVMVARHAFAAEVKLPPTQKEVIKTIARYLPALPTNDRGDVKLCAAYLKHPAGCSRGTVSTVNHILEKALIWTLHPVNEYRDGKVEKAVYAHFADGIEPTEESFLAAVINAKIEAPQRGGARTRTITLKSVQVDDLLCPEHGDAGAVTHATTYCTAGSCGEIHAHDPVIHKAGWLSDGAPEPSALMLKFEHQDPDAAAIDAQDDGAAVPDAQPLTYRKPGLLMSKLEHQGDAPDLNPLESLGDQLRDLALDPSLPPEPTCIDCHATLNVYGIKRCDPCRKRWLSEGGG